MEAHPSGTADGRLRLWYQELHPVKLDIVGDFAGKELFAIHGESLVTHCISKAKVDFGRGFQLLHAIHAVEVFLANLKERGCNFQILWFDQHEELCIPPHSPPGSAYKYTLTRAVLIEHLGRFTNDGRPDGPKLCYRFSRIDCDEFRDYLATNAIHFIMCSDGASSDAGSEPVDDYYKHIVHEISRRGYCVAFINDLEFRSARVHARLLSQQATEESLRFDEPPSPDEPDVGVPELVRELKVLAQSSDQVLPAEGLSGREIISLLALANILDGDSDEETKRRAAAFLVHTVLVGKYQLSRRACAEPGMPCEETEIFLEDICDVSTSVLRHWQDDTFTSDAKWDCFDLVDGRVYLHILEQWPSMSLDDDVRSDVEQLAKIIATLANVDLVKYLPSRTHETVEPPQGHTKEMPRMSTVLPFKHPVVDRFLQDINVEMVEDPENIARAKTFEDLTHWHNTKRLVDPKHVPKVMDFRARRREQKFTADTLAYAASLTNASGKSINPETIVVQLPTDDRKASDKRAPQWKDDLKKKQTSKQLKQQKKQPAKSGRAIAHEAVQALEAEKLEGRSVAVVTFWHQRCKEFEREGSLVKRYLKAAKYTLGLPKLDMDTVGGETTLYACNILALLLNSGRLEGVERMSILAILWSKALDLHKLPLTKEVSQHLATLHEIFSMAIKPQTGSALPSRPLPFKSTIKDLTAKPQLPMGALEFQLEHCGPYLDRSFDSVPDPRVDFNPDAWQRKVLDAIDADKSLLVIAPTSAGKTFISFYAMKKILRESDEGVLVYVAPTKALVNQIAAEIQARFSKNHRHEGKSVWAIHTRDYRVNNPTGCQILVTVPHMLQIMLLAPSNAKSPTSWSRRVKRIIFDEVHSIGQAEDGIVWEQLLLLAPCPIIALSATIGNPEEFTSWLEGTQKAKGFDFTLVVHSSRYSDLRKFIYSPPKDFSFDGFAPSEQLPDQLPLPGLDAGPGDASRFAFVHPVGAIVNRNRGALDDISFEPRDCLTLWKCISKHQTQRYRIEASLQPQKSLPALVTKSDATKWETALKTQLQKWMVESTSPFSSVCQELRPGQGRLPTAMSSLHIASPNGADMVLGTEETSLFPLLVDLRSHGALPALIFNYDRAACERRVLGLYAYLKQYQESSPKWEKKMAKFEKLQKNKTKTKAKPSTKSTSKGKDADEPGLTKAELDREEASREADPLESFDPNDAMPEFSFADSTKISHQELETMLKPLKWVDMDKDIILALRRGLGVHHAGMNRKYRQIVEILFRKGYLTVVIATGTLAMGINMPCKTVVFSGDSVFLTALNYRQASGRAGRRGFDLLGNVVFHGIPQHRAFEIMSTRLPDLKGQFPTSVTLILRLFNLLNGTENSDYAVTAMETLLSQTRLYLGGPSSQMAIKHHLRFSIDYLRRQHLLSATGVPVNFSGFVSRLYFTENAAFAFHTLLKDGYFQERCADFDRSRKDILLELVLVLCHLFCRIPCYRYKQKKWLADVVHRSPSIVLLPPLPSSAESILREHNKETLRIFQGYVSTFVNQHLADTPDYELPFTNQRVGPDTAADTATYTGCSIPHLAPTNIRSPFAALSGFTDEFSTIGELCSGVRGGVYLEESAIPYIPIYPEEGCEVPFNAYIYDFFKHGDLEALIRDNDIKRGDVWFLLKDFSLVLATVVTGLANFLDPNADTDDAAMINLQDAGDIMEEDAADVESKEDLVAERAVLKEAQPSVAPTKKKGKKVVDSWDDESSEDEEVEVNGDPGVAASDGGSSAAPAWEGASRKSLENVHKALEMVQVEFNEKFMKVWA